MKTLANTEMITDRVLDRAAHEAARMFFGESFDDYAASVLTRETDGSVRVSTATGANTWDALKNAAQDYARAARIADMRFPDAWATIETLEGSIRVRPIESGDAVVVAYLFKR